MSQLFTEDFFFVARDGMKITSVTRICPASMAVHRRSKARKSEYRSVIVLYSTAKKAFLGRSSFIRKA